MEIIGCHSHMTMFKSLGWVIETDWENPLWSSGLGHSSGKQEALGSTPTGGAFTFLSLIKECSKELFIIFIESKHLRNNYLDDGRPSETDAQL